LTSSLSHCYNYGEAVKIVKNSPDRICRGNISAPPYSTDEKESTVSLTPEQIEEIAVAAATRAAERTALTPKEISDLVTEAVRQTLIQLGIDQDNPIEMQKDFQHLRDWRKAGEEIKRKGMVTLVGIFLAGIVSLVLIGVRDWFTRGSP
jgi:predicted HTH transcriptional regulator